MAKYRCKECGAIVDGSIRAKSNHIYQFHKNLLNNKSIDKLRLTCFELDKAQSKLHSEQVHSSLHRVHSSNKNHVSSLNTKEFDDFKLAKKYFSKEHIMPNEKLGNSYNSVELMIHEYGHLAWFNSQYSRFFPSAFLLEKVKYLDSEMTKAWITFCISNMDDYVKKENEEFDGMLEDYSEYSPLTFEELERIFHKYKPFITLLDYFKFAYDNMDSSLGQHFVILLMIWMEFKYPVNPRFEEQYQKCDVKNKCKEAVNCRKERLCTLIKARYGKDYRFEDEMREYQQGLINDFVELATLYGKSQPNAIPFLLKTFDEINKTGKHRDKLYTTLDKIYNLKDAPLTGKLYITWDKVDFYDGFYTFQHPKISYRDTTKFYSIRDTNSRKVFNEIGSYFLKRLPPIHVEFENGHVKKILNKANLALCITTMEHRVTAEPHERKKEKLKPGVQKKELTKSEAIIQCREHKSRFLNYLAACQLDDYKVICSIENRVSASSGSVEQEYSFIFTIKKSGRRLFLAYENVKNARCTYIFPINESDWQRSIDALYEYFASGEVNKREALSQRSVDIRMPGNYAYKRIMHTDYMTWVDKIKYCQV